MTEIQNQILFGPDYCTKFDGSTYLKVYYGKEYKNIRYFVLRCCHEVFQSLPGGLSVLDFGSGPSPYLAISAAAKASEIVQAEYTESNRKMLRQWLEKDSDAYDWSPYFSHVVQVLEEKAAKEVEARQNLVRQLVKDVVCCDILQDPPIQSGYNKQYDVVMSSFCICSATRTEEEFLQAYKRLGKLVKPGGVLMTSGIETEECDTGAYYVGNARFLSFGVTREFRVKVIREAGFTDISIEKADDERILSKEFPRRRSTLCVFMYGRKV